MGPLVILPKDEFSSPISYMRASVVSLTCANIAYVWAFLAIWNGNLRGVARASTTALYIHSHKLHQPLYLISGYTSCVAC